jgi:hypothetical protein
VVEAEAGRTDTQYIASAQGVYSTPGAEI